jgi:hypothetical protein
MFCAPHGTLESRLSNHDQTFRDLSNLVAFLEEQLASVKTRVSGIEKTLKSAILT